MPKEEKALGWRERVKALVDRLGSVEAVAASLGISFHTVDRWVRGTNEPSPLAQAAIAALEKEDPKP